MLKYLDDDKKLGTNTHRFEDNEIDIDVTNYKIRMGRFTKKNSKAGTSEECVYHTFDSDPLEKPKIKHRRNSKSISCTNSFLSKPNFAKISQIDCFDIQEGDEPDSSFSSICDNQTYSRNISESDNEVKAQTRSTDFKVKSPAYCKRSAAEYKVKDAILTCYTIKAHSIIKQMRKQKHQKAHSCSTSRNEPILKKFGTANTTLIEPKSAFKLSTKDELLSTPSELVSNFDTVGRSTSYSKKERRTRESRNVEPKHPQKFVFNINTERRTNSAVKSIQSVTVYKGPIAKAFSINLDSAVSPDRNKDKGLSAYSSFEEKLASPEKPSYAPVRRSVGIKDYKEFKPKRPTENAPRDYKASKILPGTSNLIISQDIPKGAFRNSWANFGSPLSNSTRSSLVRTKFAENPSTSFNTVAHSGRLSDAKTRNLSNSGSVHQSIKSLSSIACNPKKVHKNSAQKVSSRKNKVVLMAKVNLDKDSNDLSTVQKAQYLTVNTSLSKSKLSLSKKGSTPLISPTASNLKKMNSCRK
jgi:hypothetical protein